LLQSETRTSAEVALQARAGEVGESDPDQYASQLRREKRVFGVCYQDKYLHPAFQFRTSGDVHSAIARLLEFLPATDANWPAASWLFQPHGRLGGKSPAEVFQEQPNAVVDLARANFVRGPYEGDVIPR
jgi:hypothetical protein